MKRRKPRYRNAVTGAVAGKLVEILEVADGSFVLDVAGVRRAGTFTSVDDALREAARIVGELRPGWVIRRHEQAQALLRLPRRGRRALARHHLQGAQAQDASARRRHRRCGTLGFEGGAALPALPRAPQRPP